MTRYLPNPSSDSSFSRALAEWRAGTGGNIPEPEIGEHSHQDAEGGRGLRPYVPYAVALTLALGFGAAAASLATAPALTDSIETVAAIDARQIGFAANLDPSGQQKKATTLSRDIGSMKSEIARLQRTLDQSRASQTALSKATAGQAAAASDEVKTLKSEIAALQKTLDSARGDAASKIEGLTAKLDQSKQDAAQVAQLRERLERFEKFAQTDKTPASPRRVEKIDPETTGSIDAKRADAKREIAPVEAQPEKAAKTEPRDEARYPTEERQASRNDGQTVVRNWTVREVVRGVALLEGRGGMIEVVRGARAPGMGRVRSIERRDGQWVVVTDRGIVLERDEL